MRMTGEQGFTLVELILAILVTSTVVGAIGSGTVVGLRTTDATHNRLVESHDAQMVAAYLVSDAQSAGTVSDVVTADFNECTQLRVPPPAVVPGFALTFAWTDKGTNKLAAYLVENLGGERRLTRFYCEETPPAATALVNTVTVVHALSSSGSGASVSCTVVPLPSGPCTSEPDVVTISVTEASGYSFQVSGARRRS